MTFAWEYPGGFHRCDHLEPKLLIAIKDQVFVRASNGNASRKLLDDPSARRMLRDVNVQDAPPIMTDNKKAIEHAKRNRWHSEEIHRCNRFPMVSKEGQPAPGPVRIFRRPFHPTGDGSLGKVKAEHAEFPHVSAALPRWGFQRPCGRSIPEPPSASGLLPACLRTLQISRQYIQKPVRCQRTMVSGVTMMRTASKPTRPASDYPEELIEEVEARARMSTLQRNELLTQSKILKKETSPPTKEANQHAKKSPTKPNMMRIYNRTVVGRQQGM